MNSRSSVRKLRKQCDDVRIAWNNTFTNNHVVKLLDWDRQNIANLIQKYGYEIVINHVRILYDLPLVHKEGEVAKNMRKLKFFINPNNFKKIFDGVYHDGDKPYTNKPEEKITVRFELNASNIDKLSDEGYFIYRKIFADELLIKNEKRSHITKVFTTIINWQFYKEEEDNEKFRIGFNNYNTAKVEAKRLILKKINNGK